ncbi:hypothetical protein SAMN05660860_03304 [Geoalkalibacter ferrihydriticus]|uniref:DUF7507 domain-containing protein n=1 Tax=Geoalkalibacter ferrihydriticus TaxID=392333 RepID=A0A1G9WPD3_9BACT|nr:hypothetical protein SAMN05660860_03304 [Geoalkalibacter ferrihydriticus]
MFFRYVVTNDGPVTLTNLTLTDNVFSTSSCIIPATLAPGQSFECVIGPFEAMAGQHTNTATATGQYQGMTVMDSDNANYYGCVGKGTGTPGYWMNHPEAWPVDSIIIGGIEYSKKDAIDYMKKPVKRDKTMTMFPALVSAKLNVLSCNVSFCIDETILAADEWMAQYGPVGSGVLASSSAWSMGEPLYLLLDEYNNGLLCAPSRDKISYRDCDWDWDRDSDKDSDWDSDRDSDKDSDWDSDRDSDSNTSFGTGTQGYWQNHPKAWPVDRITVGGKRYSKDEAIKYMKKATKGDVTMTMFHALVSAKLNVASGTESSCIADTIKSADSWMDKYGPAGEKVRAGSWAWRNGEPLYMTLDDYNNGKLCAPSRDQDQTKSSSTSGPKTATSDYWQNNPKAWPVDRITVGDKRYSISDAIKNMGRDSRYDVTVTLYRTLVSAKLNVASGTESSCIADTIKSADSWMDRYGPVGEKVKPDSWAWRRGEPLHTTLDDYNKGKLCAP